MKFSLLLDSAHFEFEAHTFDDIYDRQADRQTDRQHLTTITLTHIHMLRVNKNTLMRSNAHDFHVRNAKSMGQFSLQDFFIKFVSIHSHTTIIIIIIIIIIDQLTSPSIFLLTLLNF